MSFGITYEMIITIFIVVFGLLFIVMGYNFLAVPFVQLAFLFGLMFLLIGWAKKDYDTFYGGLLLLIIPVILLSVFPSVGVSKTLVEGGLLYAIMPIILGLNWLYSLHPIVFVIVITLLAYGIMRK